jgi:hypothetical protein
MFRLTRIQLAVSQNRVPPQMMTQSLARFGWIRSVPPVPTGRLTFPTPATAATTVSESPGIGCYRDGRTGTARTYTWRLTRRRAAPATGGAQRRPDIGGQRHRVLAGSPASQDDPPRAPIEVLQLRPRRLVDRRPKCATSVRIA